MKYSYAYALLGILYYPLMQLWFYSRFGRWDTSSAFSPLIPATGVLACALFVYMLNSTASKTGRSVLWIVFLLAGIPLSLLGVLGGGLLGPIGIVAWGVIPPFVVLFLTKGLLKLFIK